MPDTQMVPRQFHGRGGYTNDYWALGDSSDRDVLKLSRGCPHSTVTTAHGWGENLTLELHKLKGEEMIDLATDDVRVGYSSVMGRIWNLKPGTATGTLYIEPLSDSGVIVSYDPGFPRWALQSWYNGASFMPVNTG